MSEIVKVIIPSYKRADRVHALGAINHAALCVAKNEADEYREHNPGVEIIEHPSDMYGYNPKGQWILNRFPNCFLLDDDISSLMRKWHVKEDGIPVKVDPKTAYEIVQSSAEMCQEMGAYHFGFSSVTNPASYQGLRTHKFTGFIVGGACGFLEGGGLYFDQAFHTATDHWMSLYNAYRNRYCLIDLRYVWADVGGTFQNSGGDSEYRNKETQKQDLELLEEYFGKAVEPKGWNPMRKLYHEHEITTKIPF